MVNRVVTGAHYGLGSWLAQRISAVIIAAYSVILLIMFTTGRPLSYQVRGAGYRLSSVGPAVSADDPRVVDGRRPISVVPGE